jgi:hypothetical protein
VTFVWAFCCSVSGFAIGPPLLLGNHYGGAGYK